MLEYIKKYLLIVLIIIFVCRFIKLYLHPKLDASYIIITNIPYHPKEEIFQKQTISFNSCQLELEYPRYLYSESCLNNSLIVMPLIYYGNFTVKPSPPVKENGILFHIYSDDHCQSPNRYMNQLETNINAIRNMEPNSNIALATNCNVPLSIAQKLTVLIPIHDKDIIRGQKQWYTRLLYNAYAPFNYTFILDTHVFPCYNTSYSEIFRLFKESNVDISISNRKNTNWYMGAAVLSKWGPRSFDYWIRNVRFMKRIKVYEDQYSAFNVLQNQNGYTFKLMSSNWFFASHGITEKGKFVGSANCYRSSIVVTGPVRWVHGPSYHCTIMNGKHNEYVDLHRVYFQCGNCNCTGKAAKFTIATSENELKSFVSNYSIPSLLWEKDHNRSRDSLFWSSSYK